MTDHRPEPWRAYRAGISVGTDTNPSNLIADCYDSADGHRIVACVNACAGIPTEQLGDVKALVNAARVAGHWLATEFATDLEDDNFYAQDVLRPLTAALAPFQKD